MSSLRKTVEEAITGLLNQQCPIDGSKTHAEMLCGNSWHQCVEVCADAAKHVWPYALVAVDINNALGARDGDPSTWFDAADIEAKLVESE